MQFSYPLFALDDSILVAIQWCLEIVYEYVGQTKSNEVQLNRIVEEGIATTIDQTKAETAEKSKLCLANMCSAQESISGS